MNAREQYLKMRCDRLEAELKVALHVLDRALADLEFTESVGAAFAFDLQLRDEYVEQTWMLHDAEKRWGDAVKALESQNDDAKGIVRHPDGSINFIKTDAWETK